MNLKMNGCLSFGLLFLLSCSLTTHVYSCSCPIRIPNTRSEAISELFCSSPRIYVATVIGATCNCIPVGGESVPVNVNCQDYQLRESEGSTVVEAQILARGVCNNDRRTSYPEEFFYNCTAIGTSAGVLSSGLTLAGTPTDQEITVNTTTDFGVCRLSCPLNQPGNDSDDVFDNNIQPCFYRVRVDEVFKGNIMEGEVMTVSGPDVTTTCGRLGYVLQLNRRYVVGIGSICYPISNWDTYESYQSRDFEQLRDLGSNELTCSGVLELLPSLTLSILALLVLLLTVTDCQA